MDDTGETVLIVLLVLAAVVCVILAFCCWWRNYIQNWEDLEHTRLTDESPEPRGTASYQPQKYGVVLKEDSGGIVGDVVSKFISSYNDVTKTLKLTQSGDVTVVSRPPSSLLIVPCLIQTRLLTDIERVVGASGVKSADPDQVLLVLHHKAPHDVYVTPTRAIIGSTQVASLFQNNIIDVVFQNVGNANKLHRCEQNATAVKELQRLVEGAKL